MSANLLNIVSMILILLASTGCELHSTGPIRIGFLGSLEGSESFLGQTGFNGALLAIEQINAAGGINGRQVELIARDDRHSQAAARAAVAELLEERVAGIIGPMTSDMAVAVAGTTDQARVPILSPTVSTHQLTGVDDYFLRIYPTTDEGSLKVAHFARHNRGIDSFAVVYDLANREFSLSWLDDFSRDFEAVGGRIDLQLPIDSHDPNTSFHDLATRIKESSVGGVLILCNQTGAALLGQNLHKLGAAPAIFLTEWSYGPGLIEHGGPLVDEMMVFKTYFGNQPTTAPQDFVRIYAERFGAPPWFTAAHSYDATRLLLRGVQTATTPAEIKQAILANGPFEGVETPFNLDRFGEVKRPHYLSRFHDDREELLAVLF